MSVLSNRSSCLFASVQLIRLPSQSVFNMSSGTIFKNHVVPKAPADLHYGLRAEFQADAHPDKVNLVIGAYKDDSGNPWVLPVVKKVCISTNLTPIRQVRITLRCRLC